MPNQSATINVMIQAARKAAKSLLKDFTEVENLQASTKSPGDFVSKADLRAERIIKYELEACIRIQSLFRGYLVRNKKI